MQRTNSTPSPKSPPEPAGTQSGRGLRFIGNLFLDVRLTTLTGMRIGQESPYHFRGVDLTPVVHPLTRIPYVPGTALKGSLRYLLEWLEGVKQPGGTAPDDSGAPCAAGRYSSAACVLFGTATRPPVVAGAYQPAPDGPGPRQAPRDLDPWVAPPRLVLSDLLLLPDSDQPHLLEARTSVTMDRLTAASNPRLAERVPPGRVFTGRWSMALFIDPAANDRQGDSGATLARELTHLHRFFAAVALLNDQGLGQEVTRGAGQVNLEVETLCFKSAADYTRDGGRLRKGEAPSEPELLEDLGTWRAERKTGTPGYFDLHRLKRGIERAGTRTEGSAGSKSTPPVHGRAQKGSSPSRPATPARPSTMRLRMTSSRGFQGAPFHSDTLFGGMCWAWKRLFGALEPLLDPALGLALSSAMPYLGSLADKSALPLYLWKRPRPGLLPEALPAGDPLWLVRSRAFRGAFGWISESVMQQWQQGKLLPSHLAWEEWKLEGETSRGPGAPPLERKSSGAASGTPVTLTPLGLPALYDEGKDGVLLTREEAKRMEGRDLTGDGVMGRTSHTRVSIHRFEGAARHGQLFFDDVLFLNHRQVGLWWMLHAPEAMLEPLLAACSLLADMGLGGERSSGHGQFQLRAEPMTGPLQPTLEPRGGPHLLLSMAQSEDPQLLATGAYDAEARQGMTDMAAGGRFKPKQDRLLLLPPGAVFEPRGSVGGLTQVREATGDGPPVYRLTRALWLPWTQARSGQNALPNTDHSKAPRAEKELRR